MTVDRLMTWRLLTAASVLVSAVVHLQLWLEGFRAIPVIGPAFLLNAVGGGAIAVAVLAWRHWLPLAAAVAFGAGTLAAFLVSTTVGLFGVQERLLGGPQVLAAVSEVTAIVFGLWAWKRLRAEASASGSTLRSARPDPRRPGRAPRRAGEGRDH